MTTPAAAPDGGGNSTVLPAASALAARPRVWPTALARWSSAMSAATRGAGGSGSKPGAAHAQEEPTIAVADGANGANEPVDASGGEPVGETMNAVLHRAPAQRTRAPETHDLLAHSGGGVAPEADAAAALSLRELRARHLGHRQAQFDAGLEGSGAGSASHRAVAGQPEPRGEPVFIGAAMPAAMVADQIAGSGSGGATEQLQSLIESCCSRMWVSDHGDRAGAPRGVMLDLGSWMPGCTLEVARAAGTLRIMLRGVHDARRAGLERELEGLSAGLAESLGCQVVTAVESRGAMR